MQEPIPGSVWKFMGLENDERMDENMIELRGMSGIRSWRKFQLSTAIVCLALTLSVVFMPGCGKEAPPASTPQAGVAAPAASQALASAPVPAPVAVAWAAVSGQGGAIGLPDGSKRQITAEATTVPSGGIVELTDASSAVRLAYDGGGTIDVTGKGVIQSRSDGFETKNAAFTAAFKRGRKGFSVRVPGAVLGVRGTTIGFNLNDGIGSVTLVEGQVAVQPEQQGMAEFEWRVGQTLALAAGKIDKVIPAKEEASPVVEPDTQPQPDKPADKPADKPKPEIGKQTAEPKSPFENKPESVFQQPDTMTGDGGDGFGGN